MFEWLRKAFVLWKYGYINITAFSLSARLELLPPPPKKGGRFRSVIWFLYSGGFGGAGFCYHGEIAFYKKGENGGFFFFLEKGTRRTGNDDGKCLVELGNRC